ncbi:succinic semialdehyde dehydrogenase [Demequina maris]|uniref:succinic semialdehyde dehydrogenase n=1 Tax=Demequina maris TaxID=1638982 RepID=UPI00078371E6|nr:succinic semialdehyde dehydrogenase [Demequina maris]
MTTTAPPHADRLAPARASSLVALARGGGEPLEVRCPWDGSVLAEVPTSRPVDVAAAVADARVAQRAWADTPIRERAAVMRRVASLLWGRADDLLDIVQLESGKSRVSAFDELADVALNAAHYARHGARVLRDRRRPGALPVVTRTTEHHRPRGVVGIIAPWNYPFTLAVSDAIPALIAGNAVVLKPDSQTPLSALAGLELLRDAGLPAGVMQVVAGDGPTVGGALVDAVDFVMFTGSTATGRKVAARCGERLIGCAMELGGKNPMLVLSDADPERAAAGAIPACFSNSGQLCVSIERIYVADEVHDAFVDAFVRRTRAMSLGVGTAWEIDMASLASEEHLAEVRAHVDDAVAKGATVLAGGRARPDLGPTVYEPTILAGVTDDMRCAREETFGPVVAVHRVSSDEEAVARANDSAYGLNAAVWSRRRGTAVAARVEAGTVNVNEGYSAAWGSVGAPMGGWKDSGLGRRHGTAGILKYTQAQTIADHRGPVIAPFDGMANEVYARAMTAAVRLLTRIRP